MNAQTDKEAGDERRARKKDFWKGVNARRNGGKLPIQKIGDLHCIDQTANRHWIAGWMAGAKRNEGGVNG